MSQGAGETFPYLIRNAVSRCSGVQYSVPSKSTDTATINHTLIPTVLRGSNEKCRISKTSQHPHNRQRPNWHCSTRRVQPRPSPNGANAAANSAMRDAETVLQKVKLLARRSTKPAMKPNRTAASFDEPHRLNHKEAADITLRAGSSPEINPRFSRALGPWPLDHPHQLLSLTLDRPLVKRLPSPFSSLQESELLPQLELGHLSSPTA
jgi:hypothetical protein